VVNLIREGSFLTLHYRLLGPAGDQLVSTFEGSPATLTLGSGTLAPAMERRLLGLAEGAQTGFDLAPGEAFGERNPELLQKVRLSLLREMGDPDATYSVGDVVQFPTPDGQASYAGVVRELGSDEAGAATGPQAWLLFDFNHPLAGQAVRFEVHVIGVL
jgi:FKBP-type peptidyl-prolyl cis-trans isomerase SlpA